MNEVRDAVRALLNGRESRAADGSQDAGAARAAFTELAANGWTRVGLSEALGGTGGTLADAADVAAAATYCGAATPLADQVLIANAAADLLDITLPGGTACVVPVVADAGRAVRVPWASWATYMLVADSAGGIGLVAAGSARVTPGANIGGLPSDTVELDGPIPGAGGTIAAALIAQLGALARSVQIAAALRRCLDLSVVYARQRRQFGLPLADQSVVQQEIAALAGEVTAADAAARAAVRAVSSSTADSMLQSGALEAVMSAKVRAGLAATMGLRSAHQLHGAMGITREYELHVHTRSAWAWRDEYGAERTWAERLGDALLASPDGFWAGLVPAVSQPAARVPSGTPQCPTGFP